MGDMGGELLIEFEAAGGAALLVVWHAFFPPSLPPPCMFTLNGMYARIRQSESDSYSNKSRNSIIRL